MVATRFLKRRQRVPKPRDRAPKFTLKSSPWEARGQHRRNRQGGEGSSVRPGSQERGKGTILFVSCLASCAPGRSEGPSGPGSLFARTPEAKQISNRICVAGS